MRNIYVLVLFAALLSGCSTLEFPGVHRITIQQGNVVTQTMIDKLKPGMSKRQVQFVLGNPIVDDPLNRERWDYIYTIDIPGLNKLQRNLHVYFIEDRLSYFEGDYAPSEALADATPATETAKEVK
tara:strand:+ start:32728 stop:33105 length:378 start_codon:yes stop_codon:yes gene_type:complete